MSLTVAMVMGLGEKADGPLLGMRPFLERLENEYGVEAHSFEHDDPDLHAKLFALPGQLFLAGHSNGGEEDSRIDAEFYDQGRTLAGLCLMDAKPKWDSLGGFVAWFNPWQTYPLPKSTAIYRAFYSGFGRPFAGNVCSQKLNIGHADFPSNRIVQAWIEGQVVGLTQQELA